MSGAVKERIDGQTHIETVVVLEQELELRGEIAKCACHEPEENSGSCDASFCISKPRDSAIFRESGTHEIQHSLMRE